MDHVMLFRPWQGCCVITGSWFRAETCFATPRAERRCLGLDYRPRLQTSEVVSCRSHVLFGELYSLVSSIQFRICIRQTDRPMVSFRPFFFLLTVFPRRPLPGRNGRRPKRGDRSEARSGWRCGGAVRGCRDQGEVGSHRGCRAGKTACKTSRQRISKRHNWGS